MVAMDSINESLFESGIFERDQEITQEVETTLREIYNLSLTQYMSIRAIKLFNDDLESEEKRMYVKK